MDTAGVVRQNALGIDLPRCRRIELCNLQFCFSLDIRISAVPKDSPAMPELLRTACHAWHVAHGGRMVDFAGWEMPVQYSSIVAEHHAVRRAAGVFDIAHMGRLEFI